jgi:hypothetical protein
MIFGVLDSLSGKSCLDELTDVADSWLDLKLTPDLGVPGKEAILF